MPFCCTENEGEPVFGEQVTVIGHFLLEVPSHYCSCGGLWGAAIRLPALEPG
jgi:hypothetical protein